MVSKPKRKSRNRGLGRANKGAGRTTLSTGISKRRGKRAGKETKMPSARNPNRSSATAKRPSSARTVAATTRNRGKGRDEEE